jgi:HK97 family phage prohead protease
MKPLFKSFEYGIKDIDSKQGIITGYFSAFNSKDSDGDIIVKGAYTKTIQERGPKSSKPRIKHLIDHDKTKAVGLLTELREDDFGLYYESKAGRHTLGQDYLKMCEDGLISEHSVGFNVIKNKKSENGDNVITEILLWEGSGLQGWGANMNTPLTGVKELKEDLQLQIQSLEKAIKNGSYSDPTFKQLEIKLKSIQDAFAEITLLMEEPDLSTLKKQEPNYEEEILNIFKSSFSILT